MARTSPAQFVREVRQEMAKVTWPTRKELAVTTSSYGTPLARHYGTMRAAGSIIWSTDLIESSEKSGGGKGIR